MIRILLVAAVFALASTSAMASGLCRHVKTPPAEFQKPPNVNYVINRTGSACGGRALACTEQYAPGRWVIELPKNLTPDEEDCFLRHEKAHLPPNNWGPGHGRRCDICAVFNPDKKVISVYGRAHR